MADGRSVLGSGCRGIPRDDGDTIGDQRHAVGTLAPRDVGRILAAGTSRHERRPRVGSGTRRGAGGGDPALDGEAVAHGTSRVHPSGGVRLSLPRYRERPSAEEANARQVVTRARQHVAHDRRIPASSTEQRHLLEAFVAAAQNGDVAGLEGLFASDLVSTSDGGGFVRSARVPVVGREHVAK